MSFLPKELGYFAVFAKLLNQLENYQVALIPLARQKEIGCSGQGCAAMLTIYPPDDAHTFFTLAKPDRESIQREYKCNNNHTTTGYWSSEHVALMT